MKFFKTNNIRIVHLCQDPFHSDLPSVLLQQRSKKITSINECVMYVLLFVFFSVIS